VLAAALVTVFAVAPSPVRAEERQTDNKATAVQRVAERIRPIQIRLREDERLRAAERVVGLGMAAVGVLRGQATLSSVGTQALRLGLNHEFAAFRERSGFVVEPSFNSHGFSITFRKNLD